MKGNFKFLWMTLLMITMLSLCATASAQSFKAIYCGAASNSNKTLYFVYDTETYADGGSFTPEGGNTSLEITKVYTSPSKENYYDGWSSIQAKTVNFQSSFANYRPTSLKYWFYGLTQLETIENISNLKTTNVTDMSYMFDDCSKLTSLVLTSFDTSNVTDMSHMFSDCSKLTSLDLSSWDTSNVTDMSYLFYSCSLTNLILSSNFNTSKVTNMSYMFYSCDFASLDLSNFNTSNVTNMSYMFQYCDKLKSLDMSGWNTSEVTNMNHMFASCSKLENFDLSNFNTSEVTNMSCMFEYCNSSKLTSLNLSGFNTSKVENMSGMFSNCINLKNIILSTDFNTSNVTSMSNMFNYCNSLTSLDVSKFNTSKVTNMRKMFNSCYKLKSLDVSKFNTSKVTDMGAMFAYCFILDSPLDVSNWDTSNVTDMSFMFCECDHLTSIDVSKWNTSKVTNMKEMFYMGTTSSNPSRLTSLDVSKWDTSNVTDMSGMFLSCKLLPSLDVSKWNTSKVTNMNGMFFNCENLPSLDLSGFNTSKVTDMAGMFGQCANLTSLTFPATFSMDNVSTTDYKKRNGMFFGDVKLRYIDFSASNDADAITTIDRGNDKMFDNVPITTVIYLPHGAAKPSDNLQNVVYTSGDELLCDDYYSEDKVDIELPRAFKAAKAQYSRTMSTKFGTCVLPYEFHSNSDIQAYTLTQEQPKFMYFDEAATVPAHTAFLFQKLGNAEFIEGELGGAYNITVNATRDTSSDDGPYENVYDKVKAADTFQTWKTQGHYVNKVIEANEGTFYIAQDKFWKATTETTIPAHRATFTGEWYYPENQGAPSFSIMLADHNGETTTISALDVDREDAAPQYYDASGRRQSELQPGLNIVRKADGTVVKVMRK